MSASTAKGPYHDEVGGRWGRATLLGNCHCWSVIPIWITVGPGPAMHAVGADGDCFDSFF